MSRFVRGRKGLASITDDEVLDLLAELATLREQVETLREALKAALGHCDCSDYHGKALIPCTEANPCAGCYTTRTGQTALAATEPKG